jgi:hypothetical protein
VKMLYQHVHDAATELRVGETGMMAKVCRCHSTGMCWNAGLYYSSMAAGRLYSTFVLNIGMVIGN